MAATPTDQTWRTQGRRRGQRQRNGPPPEQSSPQKPRVVINQPPTVNEELLLIRRLDNAKRRVKSLNKIALCVATLFVGRSVYTKLIIHRRIAVSGEAFQTSDNARGRAPRQGQGNARPGVGGGAFGHHRVPRDMLQDFGSYPNILNVTGRMRREFHPVIKIPMRKKSREAVGSANRFWPWQKRPAEDEDVPACDANGQKLNSTYDYVVRDFTGNDNDDATVLLEGGGGVPHLVGTREEASLYVKNTKMSRQFDVGRYDEDRRGMYTSSLFARDEYQRTVHVGIDIGGPVGTPVYAFEDGIVHSAGYNPDLGDYGHVIVIEHVLKNRHKVYALYGHLSARSTRGKRTGQKIKQGQTIGYMGNTAENGGWTGLYPFSYSSLLCGRGLVFSISIFLLPILGTHLHFQLALNPPTTHDMPGVVSIRDRSEALLEYIGKIFDATPFL